MTPHSKMCGVKGHVIDNDHASLDLSNGQVIVESMAVDDQTREKNLGKNSKNKSKGGKRQNDKKKDDSPETTL